MGVLSTGSNVASSVASGKLATLLLYACLALAAMLAVSVTANYWQWRGGMRVTAALGQQLLAAQARATAELQACAAVNRNVVATVEVLGHELHHCRGKEQRHADALELARRQRARALAEAEGQARMRVQVIEDIGRRDASCHRGICRALSDQLLQPSDPAR